MSSTEELIDSHQQSMDNNNVTCTGLLASPPIMITSSFNIAEDSSNTFKKNYSNSSLRRAFRQSTSWLAHEKVILINLYYLKPEKYKNNLNEFTLNLKLYILG